MSSHTMIGLEPTNHLVSAIVSEFPRVFRKNNARAEIVGNGSDDVRLQLEISHDLSDLKPSHLTEMFEYTRFGNNWTRSRADVRFEDVTLVFRQSMRGMVKPGEVIERPGCKVIIENDSEYGRDQVAAIYQALFKILEPMDLIVWDSEMWRKKHPDYLGTR